LKHAKDLDSLLLIYQCSGNRQGIEELVEMASGNGDLKLMFTCNLILGKMEACLDILLKENRFPEAAFFARSHLPNAINHVVNLWKEDLIKSDKSKVAEHLANVDSPECFPDLPYMFCGQLYRDSIAVQPARSLLIEVPNITNGKFQLTLN
jgi:coatomer subunit beta'